MKNYNEVKRYEPRLEYLPEFEEPRPRMSIRKHGRYVKASDYDSLLRLFRNVEYGAQPG